MQTTILAENFAKFSHEFQKLVNRADKLGVAAPTFTASAPYDVTVKDDETGEFHNVRKVDLTFDNIVVKLSGWTFVGVHENMEGESILRSAPGKQIPAQYRHFDQCACEHCNVNRFRRETFIVENESGEFKQVGRSCLKDFLGHNSPESIASFSGAIYSFFEDIEEYNRGGRIIPVYDINEVIMVAWYFITNFGYQKADSEYPTKYSVLNYFTNPKERPSIPQECRDIAPTIREALKAFQGSEFMENVAVYSKAEHVPSKAFGYLTAGVFSHYMATRQVKEKVQYSNIALADNAGDKIVVKAKVISAITYNRQSYHYHDNGVSQVLTMVTEDNQLIKMFSSNMSIKEENTVQISGKFEKQEVETFEKSSFKGQMINYFMPRARIKIVE